MWRLKDPAGHTLAAAGKPVLLQPDRKEPPYVITVLGPPEVIHETALRVPVRITGVIPRWAYDDVGYVLASLRTAPDRNGHSRRWVTTWDDATPSLREGSFRGVILAHGGTHEGFLYFEADDDHDRTVPNQPFVALNYLDGTETLIEVDLTRRIAHPEGSVFPDGPPLKDVYDRRIMLKPAAFGVRWAKVPSAARIGDTLEVTPLAGSPWLHLTVLAPPETAADNSVRLRARITARARGKERYAYFPLQVSTAPDRNGRIHHLWDFARIDREDIDLPDSLHGVTLARGQSTEGFVYFRPEDDSDGSVSAGAFTTLWYGPRLMELPVDLITGQ